MKFDLPNELASIIKVIGVGGGGSNAVNHMHAQGIKGVDFIICNTDRQALDVSPVPVKLQLGPDLTEGLGAGSIPERGRDAAQENLDEIRQLLSARTKMVFITAGMGGGTGTGAAPVIAEVAREMGILTVGIVTMPFQWEGRKRKQQASAGIEQMRQAVDTLLVINNDRLRELFGDLSLDNAFEHADNVLTTAARGIAEIIFKIGKVNVDFEDVKTVMTGSGVAIMGMAEAEGEDRAMRAAHEALASPLLNDSDIKGAKYVLLNVTHGERPISMDEMTDITAHIQKAAGSTADVIWGYGRDESMGDKLRITVIATGFHMNAETGMVQSEPQEARRVIHLDEDLPTMITQPIVNPVAELPKAQAPEAPMPEEEQRMAEPYLKQVPAPEEPDTRTAAPVQQRSIEFDIEPAAPRAVTPAPPVQAEPPKTVHNLYEGEPETHTVSASVGSATRKDEQSNEPRVSPVEHQSRVEERLSRMRELSVRLRTPSGLSEMESEPAFRRKKVMLTEGPQSTDSSISRYTLNEEVDEHGERRVELKRNNPYLHDNVD